MKASISLAALMLGSTILGCGSEDDSELGLVDPSTLRSPATEKADLDVTVAEFVEARDAGSADEKYADKILAVKGKASAPNADDLTYLTICGPESDDCIALSLAKPDERVAWLSDAQPITVRAAYAASDLHSAVIAEIGPDPAISVTASELTKTYAEDPDGARERFQPKEVLVEGTVANAQKNDIGDTVVSLEGHEEPWIVRCTIHYDLTGRDKLLSKGERVQVKGDCSGVLEENVVSVGPAKFRLAESE